MALLSIERDRGTLAWTLTNPVSPTSVIAAKFVVAFIVFMTAPFCSRCSCRRTGDGRVRGAAGPPRRRHFLALFAALPAFYIGLTVALGTAVKSTVGVAGIAFAVMFLPQVLGGLLPIVARALPDLDRDLGDARGKGPAGVDAHADRLGDLDGRPGRRRESSCSTGRRL